ncbi:YtxH domain-containing protein [Dehalogenimonas etheniformans]|uniref:YtxH domain-containing protein n=1 Tax=Dehalogenimonas etheniformans TaxID=1536648 RepID=A0A2P5P5N0_9CHLR|nr:YtxH domain-containing protein [Dehalogenimonas etheniformans]PPD57599.1 YtxH domain-containing protein [Dehalogenimonas etheniformans]QNT75939.1 YtxH domain-containing protein [Dehalogenimonas etheniformans]
MEENTNRGLLAGLLMGTAIGVGLGLLYAPRSGAETRDMLRKRADEMKSRAESLGNSIRDKVAAIGHPIGGDGSGEAEP